MQKFRALAPFFLVEKQRPRRERRKKRKKCQVLWSLRRLHSAARTKNQQFDYQPNPQTDMHMTRATSAPPSNPPPYAPSVHDNPECRNDIQGCYCASDPRQHRPCARDMTEMQF